MDLQVQTFQDGFRTVFEEMGVEGEERSEDLVFGEGLGKGGVERWEGERHGGREIGEEGSGGAFAGGDFSAVLVAELDVFPFSVLVPFPRLHIGVVPVSESVLQLTIYLQSNGMESVGNLAIYSYDLHTQIQKRYPSTETVLLIYA